MPVLGDRLERMRYARRMATQSSTLQEVAASQPSTVAAQTSDSVTPTPTETPADPP